MTVPAPLTWHANKAVEGLMTQVAGAVAAVISTPDGFDVASRVTTPGAGARLAAMASSITAICGVVGEESEIGANQSICIEAENGYVVMVHIAHPAHPMILNLVAHKDTVLAQMVYFARVAAQNLAEQAVGA
ncbi:MAG: hypothetical protein EOP81_06520 [Variovorax sp.]|nr:MAG: hypothetical protein EOP81_06520 [Variovorax sp.]